MAAADKSTLETTNALSVSTKEAARLLGYSPATLANWRKTGKGPDYVRVGQKHSRVTYKVDTLRKWLDSKEVHASDISA